MRSLSQPAGSRNRDLRVSCPGLQTQDAALLVATPQPEPRSRHRRSNGHRCQICLTGPGLGQRSPWRRRPGRQSCTRMPVSNCVAVPRCGRRRAPRPGPGCGMPRPVRAPRHTLSVYCPSLTEACDWRLPLRFRGTAAGRPIGRNDSVHRSSESESLARRVPRPRQRAPVGCRRVVS